MIISVASGKGGTGKTTIATSLALSLKNAQYIDCDVEAPNGHLFLNPEIEQQRSVTIQKPQINESKCTFCGECSEVCQFNAIAVLPNKVLLFDHLCHGCGACMMLCPEKAITEQEYGIGVLELGKADDTQFGQGVLTVGESLASPVIKQLKKFINHDKTVILDAPPGTHCPVVETVHHTDYCILVTEATPFGLNDLKLAVEMLQQMSVPCGVVINKSDRGPELIETYCDEKNVPIIMEISFDRRIAEGYSRGEVLIRTAPEYKNKFINMFEQIQTTVREEVPI